MLNGAVYQMGEGFLDATTVVPLFLSQLTRSNALIGFCTSLPYLGWLLPQFLVVGHVARHPRQMWLYRRAATGRAIALALLAALAWPLHAHPAALLAVFVGCYAAYCFGGGIGAVPFMEIVGKTVPRERLGMYWAQRLFWGGLLAAGTGLVVREVLRGGVQPHTFALLFGLGTVFISTGYFLFASVREPEGIPGVALPAPLALLREGARLVREDTGFRRLFVSRATLSVWTASSPFIVLFAVHELGGGARATGTFLFARVAGFVLSNLGWQALSRRVGNRAVMRVSTALCAGLALAAAAIAYTSPWSLGWLPGGAAVLALEGIACLGGAAEAGLLIGYASLVIERAPPGRRQVFVALMNTFLGFTMVLPAIGGALVDVLDAPLVFALCGAAALFGYRAASRLDDGRGVTAEALTSAAGGSSAGGGGR